MHNVGARAYRAQGREGNVRAPTATPVLPVPDCPPWCEREHHRATAHRAQYFQGDDRRLTLTAGVDDGEPFAVLELYTGTTGEVPRALRVRAAEGRALAAGILAALEQLEAHLPGRCPECAEPVGIKGERCDRCDLASVRARRASMRALPGLGS